MSEVEAGKFHAGAAQKGYALNRLCYSLNHYENRAAFKADPGAYCDKFGLSGEERDAALTGDKEKLLAAGANMYFFAKLSRVDRPAKEP